MKILFIEDEQELNVLGATQIGQLGHEVISAFGVEEARKIMESEDGNEIDAVIADHRLPDGWGVDYLVSLQKERPTLRLAIVSGCLTAKDEEALNDADIPYFRKPLIYSTVIKRMRHRPPPVPKRREVESQVLSTPPPAPPPGKNLEISRPVLEQKKGLTSIIFGRLTRSSDDGESSQ